MKYCKKCGNELFDVAVKCPKCGTMCNEITNNTLVYYENPIWWILSICFNFVFIGAIFGIVGLCEYKQKYAPRHKFHVVMCVVGILLPIFWIILLCSIDVEEDVELVVKTLNNYLCGGK